MREHTVVVLFVATAFGGVVIGFFLTRIFQIRDEFNELKSAIHYTSIINEYNLNLQKLRLFFLRHAKLLSIPSNKNFFNKWLASWEVESGSHASSRWEQAGQVTEMRKDLSKTTIRWMLPWMWLRY